MPLEQIAHYAAIFAVPILLVFTIVIIAGGIFIWRLVNKRGSQLRRYARLTRQYIGRHRFVSRWRRRYPRFWHFLHNRLSAKQALGLYLTLSLALIAFTLMIFGELIEEVSESEDIVQFDLALVNALQEHTADSVLFAFSWITRLGDVLTLAVVGVIIGVILLIKRYWVLLVGWIVTLAGGGLLNTLLKEIFQRARPELHGSLVAGWSFPSGHAMGSLMAYGMLAYVGMYLVPRHWRAPVMAGCVTLILLIGASRLFLGVHYFSDVVAGFVVGTSWLTLCIIGTEVARLYRRRRESRVK